MEGPKRPTAVHITVAATLPVVVNGLFIMFVVTVTAPAQYEPEPSLVP